VTQAVICCTAFKSSKLEGWGMEYPMSQEKNELKPAEAEVNYNVVNLKWLRRQNLPYVLIWILYYAGIIAFATWWTASPLTENVFSTQLR
jgi:hypothetical protein